MRAEQRKGGIGSRIFYGIACGLVTLGLLADQRIGVYAVRALGCAVCYELFVIERSAKLLPYVSPIIGYLTLCVFGWQRFLLQAPRGYLIVVLTILWSVDVGGYVFGKLFGRARVFPRLSPGKTYAGYVGSSACGVLANACAFCICGISCSGVECAAIVAGAILGDLAGSLIKRVKGVKDSSGLIPGHGGILDRFDSFLPLGYILQTFILGT